MGNTSPAVQGKSKPQSIDYTAVSRSAAFKELLRRKKAFILPYSIFFFVFYFTLPIMTSYFEVLNRPAIGVITWAWVFAFAQFIMTWTLCIIYTKRSEEFDRMVEQIKQETGGKQV
ncbi:MULTISPECIES: DUF485 domain-containing protein [Bacillales]|jgi:uncharacterized membrane protein (DUF485 family)|uniref:DUF485 domain-containing protein n=1 Tax=Brevibacillus aydinogluensis TaxID=927786 RepID=A0AA48MBD7_9BACL|nr:MULTISPECIES: DUF485 domain-containing protein [Bacillales]REK61453.1 MAG: DUF485 domain-containing protein [Brevibacillus sp.]MBR8660352.1 DUF485 domain-containing protein [Brevibacillus sp. NL20B1]MDT3416486.1 uncharacterized membrane protein (DUF485 family) [Brevibacillus aydinogluensis]NNV03570.1 DUF485 domain-containing protein [Brevibacillus sp. MCWH]UFJ60223.1 DUF485 domain-containing protein [Anoxybacillus sediminis]